MSDAIVRGEASAAQLYLDGVLNSILQEQGVDPDAAQRARVSLAQLLFYCMKTQPKNEFMTNGSTGEVLKTDHLLKYSVSLARSLVARGASGKTVVVVMRNHQRTAAVYFAVMFAGVVPFYMDPNGTAYEIKYFLELIEPCFVFCDREHYGVVTECLERSDKMSAAVVVAEDEQELRQFAAGASDDVDSFQVPDTNPGDTVMMLPTSGSTGMPKAALLNNKGLIIQLPSAWFHYTQIPKPTKRVMVLTTPQWATFTIMMTTCVVYQIPLLLSPKQVTPGHVAELFLRFRPSWTFFSPPFANSLLSVVTSEHLSSLETMILLGAPATPSLKAALKDLLPRPTQQLRDGYGTSETHGFIAIPDGETPMDSNGRVINIFHYKLVNDEGQDLGLCQNGELYIKGDSFIKGYYKDASSYAESFTADGWFKTGDVFYIDENERLYYRQKKKFTFKYRACHVSPEEVERVVCSVPGVKDCVVCGTDRGPTAAVILQDGYDVTREQIHRAVDSTLSDHKRLHGGIAIVTSLPQTHSGKLQRRDCLRLIEDLVESGKCL